MVRYLLAAIIALATVNVYADDADTVVVQTQHVQTHVLKKDGSGNFKVDHTSAASHKQILKPKEMDISDDELSSKVDQALQSHQPTGDAATLFSFKDFINKAKNVGSKVVSVAGPIVGQVANTVKNNPQIMQTIGGFLGGL